MSDFDNPWKEALDQALEPFTALLFPAAHAEIDWSRGYELLDKELRQAIPGASVGPRVVDFLAKVWRRRTGKEEWLLVHVEVQATADAEFAERMYTYHHRLYDLYRRPVASFAVLADDRPGWKPSSFTYAVWGCELTFRYPVAKLSEFEDQRAALESEDNPFATVVLAHLDTRATEADWTRRRDRKLALIRRLYERGMSADRIRLLFKVIDWMMTLTDELEGEFWARLRDFEQERQMPYVTSVERIGVEKGLTQGLVSGIEGVLRARFGPGGLSVMPEVRRVSGTKLLRDILYEAESVKSPEELRKLWATEA